MSQTSEFLAREGDGWFMRNRSKMVNPKNDLVLKAIAENPIKPTTVLEVGCANGWRLEVLRSLYGCSSTGIDPSREAVRDAAKSYPLIAVQQGMAHHLPFQDNTFDLVIYGFCLYLVEPKWLLQVAAEGDRVLKNNGHIIIFDFEFDEDGVYSRTYEHQPTLRSYHMNFSALWSAHPAYVWRGHLIENGHEVELLQKEMHEAFPLRSQA